MLVTHCPGLCADMLEAMRHTAAEMPAELKDMHRQGADDRMEMAEFRSLPLDEG